MRHKLRQIGLAMLNFESAERHVSEPISVGDVSVGFVNKSIDFSLFQ